MHIPLGHIGTLKVKRAVIHSNSVKGYRTNDSAHSIAIRKQTKGPLMVVAIVTAMDLVQLPVRSQSTVYKGIELSTQLTHSQIRMGTCVAMPCVSTVYWTAV